MKWLLTAALLLIGSMTAPPAMAQSVCPDNFVSLRDTAAPLNCTCSAEAVERGAVYGMDVYTDDSGICAAAVHAGVISAKGGTITAFPMPGQKTYSGVTRNGISSSNWGAFEGSFGFAGGVAVAAPVAPPVVPVQPSVPMASVCPDNFVAFRGTASPLTCGCDEEAAQRGNVYGMDIYTDDSGVCPAGVHAGVISAKGGNVTVMPMPGQKAYAGVTRNGITSSNWGAFEGSFNFTGGSPAIASPAVIPVSSVTTSAICPDDFVSYRGTEKPLTCGCSAEAVERGNVYGMDIYTDDSSICQAAAHAGVISAKGGPISVMPLPGRNAYAGVTRNGITSSNWGKFEGSFSVAVATADSAPVQKPIAETLKQTGEVQLYINFAFNSADLLEKAVPVLNELLGALEADPSLSLALIGHTDAVGGADYNLSLSAKRAQSVRDWLVGHGISKARLAASGRGFSEPIADNDTEYGRAVNRRVQALRTQ